jgi:hypothetical protein
VHSCGGNSPIVNAFPINGLRPDGECDPEGVQLMPGSLSGGVNNKCDGSTLGVAHNALVGVKPDGSYACEGDALKGASFVVRSWVPKDKSGSALRTLTIHITDVQPYTADNGEIRNGYRMIGDGKSLCNAGDASDARQTLGLPVISGLAPDPPAGKDLVIPVSSELYDALGRPIDVDLTWARKEPEWLSLACVADALGERSLYDLDTDNVDNSRAALMMLVANYCGDRHVTLRGDKIAWDFVDDSAPGTQTVSHRTSEQTMLEAKWGPSGAVCLSQPRLLYRDGLPPHVPADLPDDLKAICPGCSPDQWSDAVRACKALTWGAAAFRERPFAGYTARHKPLATCETCTTDECKGRRLHSYVVIPSTAQR